jgi:hypothetical protein
LSGDKNTWEVRSLDGSLLRTLSGVGRGANPHDLQFLPNGGYQIGSYVHDMNVDTSAYGGAKHANVVTTELQQVGPSGQLVWDWNSRDHIALGETPDRMWKWVVHHPEGYDINHWNSIQPNGSSVIASFRNLDAVYKIDKATGKIVWKLGGTKTSKSLTVLDDPHSYVLGAQHDARLLGDGTVTVFNNRSNLSNRKPEAVRFAINQKQRTATLLQRITDPDVDVSFCCGSARRLSNGDWLIAWGQNGPVGGYKANGQRTFLLSFNSNYSYRAEPVPAGAVTADDLRQGMDAMAPGPG